MSTSMSNSSALDEVAPGMDPGDAIAVHDQRAHDPTAGSIWDAVREALRGSHRDFTEGSVPRAILILAIPMVLEMMMESVFAVCDVFFVSKLGASAVATVGLTESWLTLIYAIAMGLAMAATAVVARRTGERNRDGAARGATQAIILGAAVSLVIGVVGGTLAPRLLAIMGASSDVIATGTTYTRIMLGGNASIIMLFLINAIFRGAGDAAIAMRVLWLANAINIVLGPCLIFGLGPFPRLG
ncbi:MAG TPA: MATE family efflux transporter, partial [Gemmatimonadaceae bacterium]|nr:MATE family efflux transporter [Gemmatimonadaceae bacterium]